MSVAFELEPIWLLSCLAGLAASTGWENTHDIEARNTDRSVRPRTTLKHPSVGGRGRGAGRQGAGQGRGAVRVTNVVL